MPNSLGQYSLLEMEGRVRRELNDATLAVNVNTGVESTNPVFTTQLYSNTDIDQALNTSMTEAFLEMCTNHEELFAQTFYISTKANNIGPYALPFNTLKLRWLKWKSPSIALLAIRPDQWEPMAYWDEDNSWDQGNDFSGGRSPSYRREGDSIILNKMQYQDNANGIMANVVVLPPELVNLTDVVQSKFSRPLQQFMIFDAAVHLGDTREMQVAQETKDQRERAHVMLMAVVDNALQPPSVQLVSGRLVKTTYSGRRY